MGRHAEEGLLKGTEQVWAVVVPEESLAQHLVERPDVLEEKVREEVERLSRHLAPYKRPAQIVLRFDELPKTATRKIRRPLVNQWLKGQEVEDS